MNMGINQTCNTRRLLAEIKFISSTFGKVSSISVVVAGSEVFQMFHKASSFNQLEECISSDRTWGCSFLFPRSTNPLAGGIYQK